MTGARASSDETGSAGESGSSPTTIKSASALPCAGDILFCGIFCLLLFLLPDFLFSDGSTGWHLVTGNYILAHLAIPTTDIISSSLPGRAWVPYEWLFDAAAAALVKLGGLNLLAVAAGSAIALLFLLIYRDCRLSGCHFGICLALVLTGCFASSIHFLARPHLVTFFGVYFYQSWLEQFRRGKISSKRFLTVLTLAMIVWANAHPAFLTGLVMIGIYLVADMLKSLATTADGSRRRLPVLALALVLALLASLATPFGIGLYQYIFQYIKGSYVLANTAEFMPPAFGHQLSASCLEVLFAATVIGLARNRRTIALAPLTTLLCFGHAAMVSVRNEPLFVIIALPIIAGLFAEQTTDPEKIRDGATRSAGLNRLAARLQAASSSFDETESSCRLHILPVLLVVAMTAASLMGGMGILSSTFSKDKFPSETLIYYLDKIKISPASGLNFDNWGGYIRYKTGKPVFIDDRLDYYGESFYSDYGRVSMLQPGWQNVLDKYNIAWVLFPKQSALSAQLKVTPGWTLAASDRAADLFVRSELIHH